MTIVTAFLLVALGIALHAVHGIICRRMADNAWYNGYQQAAKEEQIRTTTEEKVKRLALPPHQTAPAPVPMSVMRTDTVANSQKQHPEHKLVPQSFVDEFRTNGRAACRLK